MKNLEFIDLYDEDGNKEKMKVITFFKVENNDNEDTKNEYVGNEYVVVTPANLTADEAYVLKYQVDEEGNETYTTIEDEKEFDLVSETYELLMEQSEQ